MNVSSIFSLVFLSFMLLGCQHKSGIIQEELPMTEKKEQMIQQAKWRQGEVVFIELEGGFWGIITDDGQKILPHGLPKSLAVAGNKVRFQGKIIKDAVTIQQWGKVVKITKAELISSGKQKHYY